MRSAKKIVQASSLFSRFIRTADSTLLPAQQFSRGRFQPPVFPALDQGGCGDKLATKILRSLVRRGHFQANKTFMTFTPNLRATPLQVGRFRSLCLCQKHINDLRASRQKNVGIHIMPSVSAATKITGARAIRGSYAPRHMGRSFSTGSSDKHQGSNRRASFFPFFQALQEAPLVPLVLGFAGAIPFIALSPLSFIKLPEMLAINPMAAQAGYGACILSFLGAPHWGLAMVNFGASPKSTLARFSVSTLRYSWSVIPSLLGWTALLLPAVPQFSMLISSFALALGVDIMWTRLALLPQWYMPLRISLTTVAVLSMGASLVVAIMERPKPEKGRAFGIEVQKALEARSG